MADSNVTHKKATDDEVAHDRMTNPKPSGNELKDVETPRNTSTDIDMASLMADLKTDEENTEDDMANDNDGETSEEDIESESDIRRTLFPHMPDKHFENGQQQGDADQDVNPCTHRVVYNCEHNERLMAPMTGDKINFPDGFLLETNNINAIRRVPKDCRTCETQALLDTWTIEARLDTMWKKVWAASGELHGIQGQDNSDVLKGTRASNNVLLRREYFHHDTLEELWEETPTPYYEDEDPEAYRLSTAVFYLVGVEDEVVQDSDHEDHPIPDRLPDFDITVESDKEPLEEWEL
ncbi:hypothetical protein FBEOM_9497 [Fusarium beomiforme]|uniref:Uncharacterized protein n=1 Tax=Fusarium beomiforme TaxID=44412 RepID=A0A9P5AD61_9HYPO|nr:hypothetical protein FBEOM_9497 [Fusarium beomiforme]